MLKIMAQRVEYGEMKYIKFLTPGIYNTVHKFRKSSSYSILCLKTYDSEEKELHGDEQTITWFILISLL